MSKKYDNRRDVPTEAIVKRLRELSDAVTKCKKAVDREFYMSIPAECDNDADLVWAEAADRLVTLIESDMDMEWISVEDELPTHDDYIWLCSERCGVIQGWFHPSCKTFYERGKSYRILPYVTHWQKIYIPEPPHQAKVE